MVNFPTSLDTFTNPTSSDNLNTVAVPHATQHANANDAIEALEAKVGTGASTPSANTVLLGTGAGTSAFGAVPDAALVAGFLNPTTGHDHDGVDSAKVDGANLVASSVPTASLAANAVTQRPGIAVGATGNATTTSVTYVDMAEMAITLTTTGGDLDVDFSTVVRSDTAGQTVQIALSLDGAAEPAQSERKAHISSIDYTHCLATTWRFAGVAAGSHTVKGRWKVGGGTGTADQTFRSLRVTEVKR